MAESTHSGSQDVMPTTRLASAPFDKSEADIVLRSADGIDFCVRRHILLEASPVFESILSIPQPSTERRPVVNLVEDQRTLDVILRICYPIVKVKRSLELEEMERAVKAAQKYDMELPLAVLTDELFELAESSPLAVWAVGCRTGLEHVARHAAANLKEPLNLEVGHLDGVSAGDYFRLLEFHRKGKKVDGNFRFLTPGEASALESAPIADITLSLDIPHPHPDMVCVSSDGVEIFAHKACIAAASTSVQERIEKASNFTDAGHPILRFSEQSGLLADLLRLCYPDRKPSQLPSDPSKLADVLVALDTYMMDSIRGAVFDFWKIVAETSPIRAYVAAARVHLRDCAEVAAKCTLKHPLEGRYVAEMEFSPAVAYHHLLVYHASCREVAKQVLRDVLPVLASNNEPEMDSGVARIARRLQRIDPELTELIVNPAIEMSTRTRQDVWLSSFIKDLVARADTRCDYSPLSPTAFDAAIAEEHLSLWCTRCRDFARKISPTDAAVLSIDDRISRVSLVF